MTTLDDLGAWLAARDASQYAAGAASRQADVDAATAQTSAVQVQLTAAQAANVALQAAFDAYKTGHPDVPVATKKTVTLGDFASGNNALYPAGSLVSPSTVYRQTPKVSTKASVAAPAGGTCPLRLIRVGGLSAAQTATALEVAGFELVGTDQGHIFHGLTVGYSTGAKIHDLVISGTAGTDKAPPGETFSLELWHANGADVRNVTISGFRKDDNSRVGATLVGLNSVTGATLTNIVATGAQYMGISLWDSANVTVTDADFSNCWRPINIENAHAGTIRFVRPNLSKMTDPKNAAVTVNGNIASTKVVLEDPVTDLWPIRFGNWGPTYAGKPNLQSNSDITVLVGGKDVTADRSKVVFA